MSTLKTLNLLYENELDLDRQLIAGGFPRDGVCLVQIMTASATRDEAVEIAQTVQARLPNAQIVGASASGLIYQGRQYDAGTLVRVHWMEQAQILTASLTWRGKSASQLAREVGELISGRDVRLMHVLCGDHYYDIHDFVSQCDRLPQAPAMVGGMAGDVLPLDLMGYVFTPEGVVEEGLVLAALCGDGFWFYNGANTSHEAISGKHRLTGTDGRAWTEIDGRPIRQWLNDELGVADLQEYSDWAVRCANDVLARFPMMLEGHPSASRFLHYNPTENGVTPYFSQVPQGTEFRIGYVSPSQCVKESFRICNEIMEKPLEDLFCYSCLFRRLYLHNCAQWELSPYEQLEICGAFLMGEICQVAGHNEVLNGSCCLVGIAENQVYLRPNITIFQELQSIEDDAQDLLTSVLRRQQEAATRQNEALMDTLVRQQQQQREMLYRDHVTGAANYLQYREDRKSRHFDKLCMLKVENAELLATHLGHSAYQALARQEMAQMTDFLHESYAQEMDLLSLYVFNDNSFFLATDGRISDQHFLRLCKALFNRFRFLRVAPGDEVLVNRCAVVLHQSALVESALNALAAGKNTQNTFLVCEEEGGELTSAEEFKMIGVLNRALDGNGVVPYFQGIHDNRLGRVTKYEALMRLVDVDGTVYLPQQFMDIAKKYHIYPLISQRLIEQVFSLFQQREESVSINISLFDLQSKETSELIFRLLRRCRQPQRFTLEILEDEQYRDFTPLRHFIAQVKLLGARVAIDDFGTGYSNLYELSAIRVDILKVDGSIIKNLSSSHNNQDLLEVIVHMARLFQAEVVAEFVEDEMIQAQVARSGIPYSQGFHFARPLPFEALFT